MQLGNSPATVLHSVAEPAVIRQAKVEVQVSSLFLVEEGSELVRGVAATWRNAER